ncbi:MAG TPA: hypothetical protein VFV86_02330, partial [Nitrososphaeraceae archaeon]|nr:hypothetical protein [Nitrososphaeraceae archaeon]
MSNIFTVLNSITLEKRKWKELDQQEKDSINPWLLNKFLSMKEEYCELVNIIQKNIFQLSPEQVYNIYLDIIPKNKVWLKYIKSTKNKSNSELLKLISEYYQCSQRE